MKDTKKTTQNKDSELKDTVGNIGREFFSLYCEDHKVLEQSMVNLVEMANDSEERAIQFQTNRFLVEQLIGKPTQSTDLNMVNGIEIKFTRESLDEEADTPKV